MPWVSLAAIGRKLIGPPATKHDKVVSGKGEIAFGASVPGGDPGAMPGMKDKGGHEGHMEHGGKEAPKKNSKHEHPH
jgi:hypothetical protein